MVIGFLIVALLVSVAFVFYLRAEIRQLRRAHRELQDPTSSKDKLVGVCAYAVDQTLRKSQNKAKIIQLLRENAQASNEDIRSALHVSRQTVVRYMNELEKAGKVQQVGESGRSVAYQLNDPTP